jgi:rod shape determining protein RodA
MFFGRSTSARSAGFTWAFFFQPSELTKIALILALTRFFTEKEMPRGHGLRDLGVPFLMLALPALLVFRQPDLGTVVLLLAIFTSILVFVEVRFKTWAVLGAGVAAVIPSPGIFSRITRRTASSPSSIPIWTL